MASCIYCSSNQNLNTELTISLDNGEKAKVQICDVHAEDASVKTAKAAYIERQHKIEEFKKMAESLGLEIKEPTGPNKLAVVNAAPVNVPPSGSRQREAQSMADDDDVDLVDSRLIDLKTSRTVKSVGANLRGVGPIESHQNHKLSEVRELIPEEALKGKGKVEMVTGRAGAPIAIQTRRMDGLGTTTVKVIDGGGDQDLQRRFKDMAAGTIRDSHQGFGPHGEGYSNRTRLCPICKGSERVRNKTKWVECPKCGGAGEINV